MTRVSAVVLAYLEEPWLKACVDALLLSDGVEVEVIVVDNGCTDGAAARVGAIDGVTVLEPGRNLGFAGGCNLGARHAAGDIIVFVNGDAIVEPDALRALANVASRTDVGLSTASVRLGDKPGLINSAGNDIHYLGYSWAGHFGEPAADYKVERVVTGASGACMAIRRTLWEELGGFDDEFVIYHEDVDLSVRCWQQGLKVIYVPDAIAVHHYEFSRNPRKLYLIERNRLVYLLTSYEARTLSLLMPALAVSEAATFLLAIREGWWRAKWDGYVWLLRNRKWIRERRRRIQAKRRVSDGVIADRFVGGLMVANYPLPSVVQAMNGVLSVYWRAVRPFLNRTV